MDLPPDKMKMLREFPPDKKWDIIRDRVSETNIHIFYYKTKPRIKLLLNIHRNIILMV